MTEKVWRGFASDNYAGVHPLVLDAIVAANIGHQTAYGDDIVTAELSRVIKQEFGEAAEVFPVFNGTGANVTALQSMCNSWEAVICAETAHIHADEGGAPEKVAGLKLWTVPTVDGKLTIDAIASQAFGFGFVHRAQPKVVSITQSTEMGTIYTPSELREITEFAHRNGLLVHMDGARIGNAAAALGTSLREITTDVGIDVLSFGATKNGAMGAEAVVILNPTATPHYPFVRKSAMQLASKMRFISAQLLALLSDELWRKNSLHANQMAARLAAGVSKIIGVEIARPVEANAVFAFLPLDVTQRLQEFYKFYIWDEFTGEVRWMCSWDTTAEDVDNFVAAVRKELAES